jgi:hypothetical protein
MFGGYATTWTRSAPAGIGFFGDRKSSTTQKDEMDLDPTAEQRLADMSDADFAALTARVRPPTSARQLKDIASKFISGSQLDAFVKVVDPKVFANETGDVDEGRVAGHLTALLGAGSSPASPGAGGRAEAAKRFGTAAGGDSVPAARGASGRAEAERRYGKRGG